MMEVIYGILAKLDGATIVFQHMPPAGTGMIAWAKCNGCKERVEFAAPQNLLGDYALRLPYQVSEWLLDTLNGRPIALCPKCRKRLDV